jgi:hypothetical protein
MATTMAQDSLPTIYIPRVQYETTEADIAQVFHEHNIGQVLEADLVPRFHKNGSPSHKMAFITLEVLYNTHDANELMKSLNNDNPKSEYIITVDNIGHYWKLMKNTGKAPKKVLPGTFGVLIAKAIEGDEETRDECARQLGSCFNKLQAQVEELQTQLLAVKNMLFTKETNDYVAATNNMTQEQHHHVAKESDCPILSRINNTGRAMEECNVVVKQGEYHGEQVQDQDGTKYIWNANSEEWSCL